MKLTFFSKSSTRQHDEALGDDDAALQPGSREKVVDKKMEKTINLKDMERETYFRDVRNATFPYSGLYDSEDDDSDDLYPFRAEPIPRSFYFDLFFFTVLIALIVFIWSVVFLSGELASPHPLF